MKNFKHTKHRYSNQVSSCVLLLLFFVFVTATAAIADNGWKAGVARVIITPEESIWMAGYGGRDHPAEGTLIDLWAKALAIQDINGNKAVLVTADLESFPKSFSDRLRDRLKSEYGLSRSQIILNGSHTHSGPVIDGMYNIYTNDPQQLKEIKIYSDKLEGKLAGLVGRALGNLEPATIYSANGVARFQVNRRNNDERQLAVETDLTGPNDYAVPVIKIVNNEGKIVAVAFGYACHATTLSIYEWSGDYPGFAQLELEKLYPGITALFFQGAGANQNPLPRRTIALAQQYGRDLAAAVDRVLNEDMRKLSPQLATAYSEVDLKFSTPPSQEQLEGIVKRSSGYQKQWAEELLNKMESGKEIMTSYPYPVQAWKLGEQPVIILGGELTVDYAIRLKRIFGNDIFVMGYSNDVMAYIPSTSILREGGYEGASSQIAFGLPAAWAADIETRIIGEALKTAGQAGIKMTESKLVGN